MIFENEVRKETLLSVAEKMMLAAITAPKGKGADNIAAGMAFGEEIRRLSGKIKELSEKEGAMDYLLRDSKNILLSEVVVLIGTKIKPLGLTNCGLCGFKDCSEKRKNKDHPCTFNTIDLGIAIGSAVSVAMDHRVDNRIMNSVGMAARELGMLGSDIRIIYGIPLSCTSKNPFFDR
jgi:uncharacterized ferredoxin-like protein